MSAVDSDRSEIVSPLNLRPSNVRGYDLIGFVREIHDEMNSRIAGYDRAKPPLLIEERVLKAINATVQSQISALKNHHGINLERIKGERFDSLRNNGFSLYNAYYIVYGKPLGILGKGYIRVSDSIIYVSDRVTEPAMRYAVRKLDQHVFKIEPIRAAPNRQAPQRPAALSLPSPAATPVEAAARVFEQAAAEAAPSHVRQSNCCAKVALGAFAALSFCWNKIPQRGRTFIQGTFFKEFVTDPIKDIARKTTTGVVMTLSGTFVYYISGGIIAGAQAGASCAVSTAIAVKDAVVKRYTDTGQ